MILSFFCIPSLKKCHKKFENPSLKLLRPKMILIMYFECTRTVNQKSLNKNSSKLEDFVQAFGPQISIFYYLVLVGTKENKIYFFQRKL